VNAERNFHSVLKKRWNHGILHAGNTLTYARTNGADIYPYGDRKDLSPVKVSSGGRQINGKEEGNTVRKNSR